MATNENEFVPQVKTYAELSKDQYKAFMSQAAAADAKPALPTLYPPGTLISGAPLNQPPAFPGALPPTFLPPAAPFPAFGFPPSPFFPAPIGLPFPGTIISSSAAPTAAAK